jgi:superfamily II DNA or RNA helicase
MANIIVLPKYCRIDLEDDTSFLQKLDKHLSFKYVGVEFNPLYKRHLWDGIERLLSKKLEFLSGLLDRVKEFYTINNKQFNVIDLRPKFVIDKEIDLTDKLNKLGITPYDYQLEAVEYALKYDRLIFKHATGSGKSITSALITAKLNKSTIIYVISKDLLHQFHQLYSKLFDEEIGIIGDGLCNIQRITIMTVQTAGRALGMNKADILIDDNENEKFDKSNIEKIINYIKTVKIHQVDECHCAASKTIKKIYKAINPEKLLGYSGTPVRDDGADLLITGILGNVIYEVSASELIRRGILAKPYIKFNYVKGNAHFTETYPTVYSNHIVNNNYRNTLIMKETKKLLDLNYSVLVLFKTINHGKILHSLFEQNKIACEFLTGNDSSKKREEVKQKLLTKEANCLLASTIYDIGIDVSILSALVLAGAGKSSIKTLQRIGRVLRDGKNKPYAAVVEFIDDIRYLKGHSLIRKSLYETEPEFEIRFPEISKYKNKL